MDRIVWVVRIPCYDLSLELRLHLGKDLRVRKGKMSIGKA